MKAKALRPEDEDVPDGNNTVILIGAPSTSLDVIASQEGGLPMYSGSRARDGKSSINCSDSIPIARNTARKGQPERLEPLLVGLRDAPSSR